MKCGEFDKRNQEYYQNFSVEKYFQGLLGNNHNQTSDSKGKIIFDVGAHKGESAEFFHQVFPGAVIYSFEPNPKAANEIIQKKIPGNKVFQLALTDFNGNAVFNLQDISHLSSLVSINRTSRASLGYAEREEHQCIEVEAIRGDEFVSRHQLTMIDLLKIDVQANEVKTIQGFAGVISKVKVIFVEVSFYDFYSQKSSIREIESALPNFELYDIYEVSKNPKSLGVDWATLVYKNTAFPS
jgi:FkbM family methyltransferase